MSFFKNLMWNIGPKYQAAHAGAVDINDKYYNAECAASKQSTFNLTSLADARGGLTSFAIGSSRVNNTVYLDDPAVTVFDSIPPHPANNPIVSNPPKVSFNESVEVKEFVKGASINTTNSTQDNNNKKIEKTKNAGSSHQTQNTPRYTHQGDILRNKKYRLINPNYLKNNQYININIFNWLTFDDEDYKLVKPEFDTNVDSKDEVSGERKYTPKKDGTGQQSQQGRSKLLKRVEYLYDKYVVDADYSAQGFVRLGSTCMKNKALRDALIHVLRTDENVVLCDNGDVYNSQFDFCANVFTQLPLMKNEERASKAFSIGIRTSSVKHAFENLKKCLKCFCLEKLKVNELYFDINFVNGICNLFNCTDNGAAKVLADAHNAEMHATNGNIDCKSIGDKLNVAFDEILLHGDKTLLDGPKTSVQCLNIYKATGSGVLDEVRRVIPDYGITELADLLPTYDTTSNMVVPHGNKFGYNTMSVYDLKGKPIIMSNDASSFYVSGDGNRNMFENTREVKKLNNVFSADNIHHMRLMLQYINTVSRGNTIQCVTKKLLGYYLALAPVPSSCTPSHNTEGVYNTNERQVDSLYYPMDDYSMKIPRIEARCIELRLFSSWFMGQHTFDDNWTAEAALRNEIAIIPINDRLLTDNELLLAYVLGFLEYPFHYIKGKRRMKQTVVTYGDTPAEDTSEDIDTKKDIWCTAVSTKMHIAGPKHKILFVITNPTQITDSLKIASMGTILNIATSYLDSKNEVRNVRPPVDISVHLSQFLRNSSAIKFKSVIMRLSDMNLFDNDMLNEDLKWWAAFGVLIPLKEFCRISIESTNDKLKAKDVNTRQKVMDLMNSEKAIFMKKMLENEDFLDKGTFSVTGVFPDDSKAPLDLFSVCDPLLAPPITEIDGNKVNLSPIRQRYLNQTMTHALPVANAEWDSWVESLQGKLVSDEEYGARLAVHGYMMKAMDEIDGFIDLREIEPKHLALIIFYRTKVPVDKDLYNCLVNAIMYYPDEFTVISVCWLTIMFYYFCFAQKVKHCSNTLWNELIATIMYYNRTGGLQRDIMYNFQFIYDVRYAIKNGVWPPYTVLTLRRSGDTIMGRSKGDLQYMTDIAEYMDMYGLADSDSCVAPLDEMISVRWLGLVAIYQSLSANVTNTINGGETDERTWVSRFNLAHSAVKDTAYKLMTDKISGMKSDLLKSVGITNTYSMSRYGDNRTTIICDHPDIAAYNQTGCVDLIKYETARFDNAIQTCADNNVFFDMGVTKTIKIKEFTLMNVYNNYHVHLSIDDDFKNMITSGLEKQLKRLFSDRMVTWNKEKEAEIKKNMDAKDWIVSVAIKTAETANKLTEELMNKMMRKKSKTKTTTDGSGVFSSVGDSIVYRPKTPEPTSQPSNVTIPGVSSDPLGSMMHPPLSTIPDPYSRMTPQHQIQHDEPGDILMLADRNKGVNSPLNDNLKYNAANYMDICNDDKLIDDFRQLLLLTNGFLQTPLPLYEIWNGHFHTAIPAMDGISLVAIFAGLYTSGTGIKPVENNDWSKMVYRMAMNRAELIDTDLNMSGMPCVILKRGHKFCRSEEQMFEELLGPHHAYGAVGKRVDVAYMCKTAWRDPNTRLSYFSNTMFHPMLTGFDLNNTTICRITLDNDKAVNNDSILDLAADHFDVLLYDAETNGEPLLVSKSNRNADFLKLAKNMFTLRIDHTHAAARFKRIDYGSRGNIFLPSYRAIIRHQYYNNKMEAILTKSIHLEDQDEDMSPFCNFLTHNMVSGVPTSMSIKLRYIYETYVGRYNYIVNYFTPVPEIPTTCYSISRKFITHTFTVQQPMESETKIDLPESGGVGVAEAHDKVERIELVRSAEPVVSTESFPQ